MRGEGEERFNIRFSDDESFIFGSICIVTSTGVISFGELTLPLKSFLLGGCFIGTSTWMASMAFYLLNCLTMLLYDKIFEGEWKGTTYVQQYRVVGE